MKWQPISTAMHGDTYTKWHELIFTLRVWYGLFQVYHWKDAIHHGPCRFVRYDHDDDHWTNGHWTRCQNQAWCELVGNTVPGRLVLVPSLGFLLFVGMVLS